jgi:hypothetical protein
MRGVGTGAAQTGEAALEGKGLPEVTARGVGGAAIQTGAEMLPKALRGAANVTPVLGANLQQRALTRAIERQTAALLEAKAAQTAAPGEYMGMYIPTGVPRKMGSVGFRPPGEPYVPPTPAVEPQMVPHKELQGWTLKDVLNQVGPKVRGAAKMDPVRVLLRTLGLAGQETESRMAQ